MRHRVDTPDQHRLPALVVGDVGLVRATYEQRLAPPLDGAAEDRVAGANQVSRGVVERELHLCAAGGVATNHNASPVAAVVEVGENRLLEVAELEGERADAHRLARLARLRARRSRADLSAAFRRAQPSQRRGRVGRRIYTS